MPLPVDLWCTHSRTSVREYRQRRNDRDRDLHQIRPPEPPRCLVQVSVRQKRVRSIGRPNATGACLRNASVTCCTIYSVGHAVTLRLTYLSERIATGFGHDANGNVVRLGLSPDKPKKIDRKQNRGKFEKIDRKQNRMEEEYGIKVSQYTVEAEEHIADDRENTQRHDGAHAEAGKDGKSCGVPDNIDI